MIVQSRADRNRLVRQHDHALASGVLAQEWIGFAEEPCPLRHEVVLATSLHDWSWADADETPRFNPDTGTAYRFDEHPLAERSAFYAAGLDDVERIHPYAGLLGSLHYTTFMAAKPEGADDFLAGEAARQRRLRDLLALGPEADDAIELDRAYVRLFDNLSLFVCLAIPGSLEDYDWLAPEKIGVAPGDRRFDLRWIDGETLAVSPFPFRREVRLDVPCHDLPRDRFAGEADLVAAWNAERRRAFPVTVVGPPPA